MNIDDKLTMKTESGDTVELTVTDYKKAEPEYPFKKGDEYWCISGGFGVLKATWDNHTADKGRYEIGNIYATKEEAEHAREVQKARVKLRRKANFKPNWGG